ncbi:MAG: cobalamin biosynthesis protein CbiD [Candidatus Brocadia sp. AMX2]|nr:MAG: cobalamin biosynthesis protein CbiD [Candidatus Brocadia sp. AMX2]MBC6932660.1 cobalamin biosynthesis protein CbiD [Candidatus Brocadia sp.]MBL1169552.1 cobalamin biosynthesis protein CbiD [Candidatus Brocadia sp. AMX1]MCE7866872.1 cobalamin biosynthesis protein CbiD [Candidatus Brocadia sp. AMX2]MCQ3918600.1 cobalamin biosynthesis protein CbiD [Candidatus Brocadia sp.]
MPFSPFSSHSSFFLRSFMTLRSGYTTGSCATAAAKAAAIGLFRGSIPDEVEIDTPAGIKLRLKILDKQLSDNAAGCAVQKDAGDDPDVTNGCMVYARVERNFNETIVIDGGEGVGRVTKPGLQVPVGHAAINPVPRRMIENAIREIIGNGVGTKVIISVPNGRVLGEKTFNPKLGIMGGISIIGTTGIVRPMSEDAFKTSLLCGLNIARGIGYETVVLVPGSLGERSLLNLVNIPKDQIIQISNFVGFMLDAARERHFKKIILAGHPGKLVKLLRGDFHTHSAVSKPANDILIDIIAQHCRNQLTTPQSPPSQGGKIPSPLEGEGQGEGYFRTNTIVGSTPIPNAILNRLKDVSTVEGIVELLRDYKLLSIMDKVAEMIENKVRAFYKGEQQFALTEVGVILFDMKGSIVGISDSARIWLNLIKIKSSS